MEALVAGTVLGGKYRLDRPLAQGGMGAVWAAFDLGLEVPVAVKLMAPALAGSPELVARFEREAKAAAQLRSPHVVQVFEHGVDRGVPYIVMERLEGEDLGTRLKHRGRLPLDEAAAILEQVCKALRKAHEAGIVHRDLKPGNIFLARHDEDEIVKVLDFGIAKAPQPASGGDGTRTGVVMGSPSYMSPEQARSTKAVDHRSDLWSLGLVMFRMLTGRTAFTGETDADVIVKLCVDPVPVASQVAPDLPAEVDAWFARALMRDPERRFASAREMAAAFGQIVGRTASRGEPVTGARVGTAGAVAAVETTSSDVALTVRLAKAAEMTAPLPVEVTAPLPAPVGGATLTSAGSEAMSVPPAASRGWMAWGLLGGAAAAGMVTAGLFAVRGAGGMSTAARPSATVAATSPAAPVATASAVPAAPVVTASAVPAAPVVTASAVPAAPVDPVPAVTATASAAQPIPATAATPLRSAKGPSTPGKAPASGPAPVGDDGALEIPRVLGPADEKRK